MKKIIYLYLTIWAFSLKSSDGATKYEGLELSLNKPTPHKIVVVTMQKTGSHLITKCLHLITGKAKQHQLGAVNWERNIYWEHPINGNFNRWLNGSYKTLTIVRDPRDHILSVIRHKGGPKIDEELIPNVITDMIINFARGNAKWRGAKGRSGLGGTLRGAATVNQLWTPYIRSMNNPHIYVARFEKLVGPQGNGSSHEEQYEEISNIANFLGITLTAEEIAHVAQNIRGNTHMFVEGKNGKWQEYFTENHKSLFKKSGQATLLQLGYEQDNDW